MQIGTQDEVAAAIDGDPRLAAWQVRRSGPGWIELETRRDLARIKAPLLLVLAWPAVWRDPVAVRPHLLRARSGNYALMLVGNDDEFSATGALALADDADVAALAVPASIERVALALRARAEGSALRQIAAGLELELAQAQHENRLLIETGRALSQQREMASLLEINLRQARDVTRADAGSVYIVVGDDEATRRTLREALLPAVAAAVAPRFIVSVEAMQGQIGSGSLPVERLPSAGLAIAPVNKKGAGRALDELATALRRLPLPVIGRVSEDRLLLDLRCLERPEALRDQLPLLRDALA